MYQADNDLRRYFDNNNGRLLLKRPHYFEIYDHHFRRYRGKPVNILQLGISHGGSIQLWKEYFGPHTKIFGIDADPRCRQFEEENVRIFTGDQGDRDFLRKLSEKIPRPDILIDGGGHLMHQQVAAFEELYPFVADDGIYLCEDLHTSYLAQWGGGLKRQGTFIELSKQLVDSLNGFDPARFSQNSIARSAHSMHFYDGVLVIEKQRREDQSVEQRSGTPAFEESSIAAPPRPLFTFAILTPDPLATSRIEERIFIPHTLTPSRFKLIYGGWVENNQFKYIDENIHSADGYLIHERFPCPFTTDVLDHVFNSGKPVIFFFDESMPELASTEWRAQSGFRRHLAESMKLAHLVVVENEAQKRAFQSLNPRITVLPQKLDPKRYSPVNSGNDGPLRIIYRGGEAHLDNLLLIGKFLREAADRHPGKLEFHFYGRGLVALGEHPAFHFNPATADQQEWDEAIQRIRPDLALLPLQNTPEQSISTLLPLFEYAAYGIPVLASNVAPCRDLVIPGETGLLLENTQEAWLEALGFCLDKPAEWKPMKGKARRWLENNHALTKPYDLMVSAFEQAVHNGLAARSSRPRSNFTLLNKKIAEYQDWLLTQQVAQRDVRWMEEELGTWDKHPSFHLLITLLPSQTAWLSHTLDSLEAQVYPDWKLTVVAFTPAPEELVLGNRVCWHELGDEEDSYEVLNRLAQEINHGWVGFVEAGDRLSPQALFKLAFHSRRKPAWKVIYSDEDQISVESIRSEPLFKPDYNPGLLHAYPYVGGLCLFDRELYSQLGGVDEEYDGVEVYDLLLRSLELVTPDAIGHLAEILYTRFAQGGHSIRSRQEIWQSSLQSLQEHFARQGSKAEIKPGPYVGTHQVIYPLVRTPLVSILIPTRDHLELIKPCIDTLLDKTEYPNYEVLILNNGSSDPDVLDYFSKISKHPKIRLLDYPHPFNFSAICNFGAKQAKGELLLLLNNDTEVIHPEWLSEMVRHGLRPGVGIVGARLLFSKGTLQHAGVIAGLKGVAEHPFITASPDHPGYMMRARFSQNYSVVTAACMLVRKDVYETAGGMDESDLKVLFNDVDFCLKVREADYQIVWTPAATLFHKTSISIQKQLDSSRRTHMRRALHEYETMHQRWLKWMAFDPAYNRNLTQESNHFDLETDPALGWDPEWRPAPRILAYPGDLQGCGEYRVVAPSRALNASGLAQAHVGLKLYYPSQFAKIDPDVVVLQRQVEDDHLDAISEIKKYSRAFRIFEIDDLLHNLPPRSTHRNAIHGDELERMAEGIGMCDRLVTTTTALANAYGRFCNDVRILPNYLERAKWGPLQPRRLQGKRPRIGWAGGVSHTGDLELLHPVIKALSKEVDWIFFGMCPESLRPFIKEFHESVKLDFYPAKLASLNLDLALAPLEYHPFNEAKSALKVLEYGVLGYPVICTDIVTYQGEYPVTRVSNNTSEWIEAIRHAIADRDALATEGDTLRKHIQDHWMLEDNLDKWLEGWLP